MIIKARERSFKAATANALKPAPSEANFVFVDLGTLDAEVVRCEMESCRMLLRGIY